jgi:hypothetical protein
MEAKRGKEVLFISLYLHLVALSENAFQLA